MIKMKLFDEIPHLENDRIILGRISLEDGEAIREMVGNDNVYRYLPTFLFERQYEDTEKMIKELYEGIYLNKESLILGIYLKEAGGLCGLAEYYGYRDEIHKVSVGYRLLERYWGHHIASSALSVMIDYLYTKTDIEIITASTMVENRASARVLKKNGFDKVVSGAYEDWGYDAPTLTDKWIR